MSERGVLRQLAEAHALDALAHDDASGLPEAVRTEAEAYLDGLEASVLGCFSPEDRALPLWQAEPMEALLGHVGLSGLSEPLHPYLQEDVGAFLARVRAGVANNPVLVAVAAELAEQRLGLPPAQAGAEASTRAQEVRRVVAYMALLDAAANVCLFEPKGSGTPEDTFIHQLFTATVAHLDGIDWQPRVNFFERLKVPTIRGPFQKKYMDFKTGVRPFDDEASGGHSLQLNILEAMFQDTLMGFDDNAASGFELFCQSVDKEPHQVLGEDIVREWVRDGEPTGVPLSVPAFPVAWANLYVSWNAAFCATYREAPYFWSKLLNPAVGGIHHERHPGLFIYTRVVTLLLHITFLMSSREETGWGEHFSLLDWRDERLIEVWGRINRAAGDAYQRRVEGALEGQSDFADNLSYDAWRAGKVALWASVRTVTQAIELADDAGEAVAQAFSDACETLGVASR